MAQSLKKRADFMLLDEKSRIEKRMVEALTANSSTVENSVGDDKTTDEAHRAMTTNATKMTTMACVRIQPLTRGMRR